MILEVDQHFPQPGIVEHAIEIIKENNGLIVYPTDTVYGIGCDIKNKKAVDKLDAFKGNREGKNYSILVKDMKQLEEYAVISKKQKKILEENLPGPFTFILQASSKVPNYLVSEKGTIGIRIPRNRLCRALVKELGKPIITTSFNISGQAVINDPEDIPDEISSQIDIILDAEKLGDIPSTVVDLTTDTPQILRPGKGKLE